MEKIVDFGEYKKIDRYEKVFLIYWIIFKFKFVSKMHKEDGIDNNYK